MFEGSDIGLRLYGTYQWKVDLSDDKWWSSSVIEPGQSLSSPDFRLCSHLWRLKFYPKGRDSSDLRIFLLCIGQQPAKEVSYQLWLQNHEHPDRTISHECRRIMLAGRSSCPKIPRGRIFDTQEGFLQDKALTLGVHLSVIVQDTTMAVNPPLNPCLTTCLIPYLDDSATADILVTAGSTRIHAHKMLLSAQSALFKAMFQPGTKDNASSEVEMGDIKGPILKLLLRFMYGQLQTIPKEAFLPLFLAADAHQVGALRWVCLQHLVQHIDSTTVLEYISCADAVTDTTLMEACLKFLVETENSFEIAEQPAMHKLMQNNTALAQKLLAGIMKGVSSTRGTKRSADQAFPNLQQ